MATYSNSADGISAEEAAEIASAAERRSTAPERATPMPSPGVDAAPGPAGIQYKLLCQRHPEYRASLWRRLHALYAGGSRLFEDMALLREVFPRHRGEADDLYKERIARAFYVPYAGEIVDHLVAALFKQPIMMRLGDEDEAKSDPDDDGDGDAEEAAALSEVPEFYQDFQKDTSVPGGEAVSFNQLLKKQILNALTKQCSWTMVDLPALIGEDGQPVAFPDKQAEEAAGALDAYAVALENESVVDWKEDGAGNLEWVLVWTTTCEREDLWSSRDQVTQRWTYYDRDGWRAYALRHKVDEDIDEKRVVPLVAEGTYPFGRVPVVRLKLDDGLWAMDKLEGLAREHFNKRSGLAWGELQSLLPELYEFLGPEEGNGPVVVSEAQQDRTRAVSQRRGQGFVQVRGGQDKAQYIGPDSAPFREVRESCKDVRDEMHRVTHRMALAQDNSAAALGRSGESKAQDKAADAVVLVALGEKVRAHAEEVMNLVSLVRDDVDLVGEWNASGMEKFDNVSVSDMLKQALDIDVLKIKSPTFLRRLWFMVCRTVLGDELTDEDKAKIEDELNDNITDEMFDEPEVPPAPGGLPEPQMPTEQQLADKPTNPAKEAKKP